MSSDKDYIGEAYLEFRPVGKQVRVAAIDAATGIEVVVFGPSSAAQGELKKIALRKLQRRMAQENAASSNRDVRGIRI